MRQTGLLRGAMILLRGIAIRNPDLGLMPVHHLGHDACAARIIGLMHHRILAVEHPMVGVGPFDAHAGFVAGDDPRRAKKSLRLLGLDLKPRVSADEHVHQRALADGQAESLAEQEAQTLVGQRLKAFQINRKRMDARPKRRRRSDRGRRRLGRDATMRAPTGETSMADDIGRDRRQFDLIVFANQFPLGVPGKG